MLTRLFLVLLCMMQCILAFAQNETIVKVGMLVNDSPASLLSVSGEPAGIGVDLVKRILNELPLKMLTPDPKGSMDSFFLTAGLNC